LNFLHKKNNVTLLTTPNTIIW